ncbi:MAG: twin-arginine translocase TatA/TatE family subunit [Ktedonobacterales bacterium]
MGGLHWYDLLGLVILGLIIFGPKKLPEMGSALGRTIREFQKSMREVTNPEPPSSVPPSALQTPQVTADAAPAIAPAAPAPVVETPAVATSVATEEEHADRSAEAGAGAEAATLVEEDSVR